MVWSITLKHLLFDPLRKCLPNPAFKDFYNGVVEIGLVTFRRQFSLGLSCFWPSFDQRHWLPFFFNFRILFIVLYSRFLLVINFIHISVYMSIPISQFITPPPLPPPLSPLGVHTFVLYICVSISALQTSSSVYHFPRFHVSALIYNICFSLSDLLHSIWQSLDPSTSLQMTRLRSFLWLSNIPLYIRFLWHCPHCPLIPCHTQYHHLPGPGRF